MHHCKMIGMRVTVMRLWRYNVTNQQPMLLLNNQYWAKTFKSALHLSTTHFATFVISEINNDKLLFFAI
jgi:hypothetical protein